MTNPIVDELKRIKKLTPVIDKLEDLKRTYDFRAKLFSRNGTRMDKFQEARGSRFMAGKIIRDVKSGKSIRQAVEDRKRMLDMSVGRNRNSPFRMGQRSAIQDIRDRFDIW